MGIGLAVISYAIVVYRRASARLPDVALHKVLGRVGVVGCWSLGELPAQGHGPPASDQPGGGHPLFRGYQVDCAHLVIMAPAAPVSVFLEISQYFFFGGYATLHIYLPWFRLNCQDVKVCKMLTK
jgi:hypothetical protein